MYKQKQAENNEWTKDNIMKLRKSYKAVETDLQKQSERIKHNKDEIQMKESIAEVILYYMNCYKFL